jgi:hypothetical protein
MGIILANNLYGRSFANGFYIHYLPSFLKGIPFLSSPFGRRGNRSLKNLNSCPKYYR